MNQSGLTGQDANWDNPTLVEKLKVRDPAAQRLLYQRYWRSLYFILSHKSKDPDLAKDLAQDTFVVVLNNIAQNKLEDPQALSQYIHQTGSYLLIDYYRKQQRRQTDTLESMPLVIDDKTPELYRVYFAEQGVELVTHLLSQLSQSRDKAVLKGYFVDGKDKAALCLELGLSADAFDKVLHRARERLKVLVSAKLGKNYSELTTIECVSIVLLLTALPLLLHKKTANEVGGWQRSAHFSWYAHNRTTTDE